MSRMSVDLPEPLAPRIPWMSPRSRRIDTSVIAATGLLLATDDEALADVLDEEGGDAPRGAGRPRPARPAGRRPFFSSCGQGGGHGGLQVGCAVGGGSVGKRKSRGPRSDAVVGWASRLVVLLALPGQEGHQKSRGPDLAHGSWFVRSAVLPPAV